MASAVQYIISEIFSSCFSADDSVLCGQKLCFSPAVFRFLPWPGCQQQGLKCLPMFCRFSLYGTPLDPTIFDVSMETMGLFATSKLADDLFSPKNMGKNSNHVDEIDLMDYIIAKNSSRALGISSKMEQLLSSMYGILEVEPLDFTCSSTSDGCKIDYCQGNGPQGGSNGIGSLYYPSATAVPDNPTAPMSALQDHVQQLKVS